MEQYEVLKGCVGPAGDPLIAGDKAVLNPENPNVKALVRMRRLRHIGPDPAEVKRREKAEAAAEQEEAEREEAEREEAGEKQQRETATTGKGRQKATETK